MIGRIGEMGRPPSQWERPGRSHVFFAVEADMHHGSLGALALSTLPIEMRNATSGSDAPMLSRVELLPVPQG